MAMQQMSNNAIASSFKSPPSMAPSKKYDVFLSFRGEDTRKTFTSHLYYALCQKKVKIFIDDNELKKGDEISPALIKAIEESCVSIVIFSKDYASSRWCLNELVKILERRKNQEQIVIPVFHNIDPSHVRKQTGSYQQAFAKHEQDWDLNEEYKVQKWKAALSEAANLAGWDSQNYWSESDLINAIVEDVLEKLKPIYPSYEIKGLLGIEEKIEQVESLLNIGSNSNDVRIVGIWGMGGMGKTTLATTLHAKLHSQFEGHCFVAKVREKYPNKCGLNFVLGDLFSALLKEEIRPDAPWVDMAFFQRRLACKKVFIVLDDVDTSEQIEDLTDCLGPGSRVIVTTRDKQVFSRFGDSEIYAVKELNFHDSLQLFCLTAFREKHPKIGYKDLSRRVSDYCNGNPLALTVLGANLRSKSVKFWECELDKLQKIPNVKIHDVLKLSFDGLDRFQKDIFLDIACLVTTTTYNYCWFIDLVTSVLDACGFHAVSGIEVLQDKALIQLDSMIIMHDLIRETGREIVNQESKDPGKRSRLWRTEEVCHVLKKNKGTKVVEAIKLDMSEVVEDLNLGPDSFKRMINLRFLEICGGCDGIKNVYFPDGLGWLSDELRHLHWRAFSLESLPPNFCAEMLVVLHMHDSRLIKLWDGVQDLVHLKEIDLVGSKDLIEVPDLSKAPNLERVNLRGCVSLRQLHPSILPLPKLTLLELQGCKKIEGLKTNIHSKSLRELNLEECSSLTEFSVTSEEMTWLTLSGTAIRELPSSIWRNSKLTCLELTECIYLNTVGNKLSNDPGLRSLTWLLLCRCTQINASNLGSILGGIQSLQWLDLSGCCNLEAIPHNIQNHSKLVVLSLDDCRKLVSLPAELPPSLEVLTAVNCTSLDTHSTQESVLENMLQSISDLSCRSDEPALYLFPGDQVPAKFGFHMSTGASITIPPIPKSDFRAFIFCIILSEGVHLYEETSSLMCSIYEPGKEVDANWSSCPLVLSDVPLISDHVLVCQYINHRIRENGDHNLSFEFTRAVLWNQDEKKYDMSTEGIKGCGVLPLNACGMGLDLEELGGLDHSYQVRGTSRYMEWVPVRGMRPHEVSRAWRYTKLVRGFSAPYLDYPNYENEDDQYHQ